MDKALEVDPKYIKALVGKALALSDLQRYQEAIEWYDKALLQYYYSCIRSTSGYRPLFTKK